MPRAFLAALDTTEAFLIDHPQAPTLAQTLAVADVMGIGRLFPLELWLGH